MGLSTSDLPLVNAIFNSIATFFLIVGRIQIYRRREKSHARCMILAFVASVFFLTSYLTYHFQSQSFRTFPHEGTLKILYYAILVTHIPLAGVVVPGSVMALYFAFRKNFVRHKKIVRWLFPIWLYVSITGVIIYLMLNHV